MSRTTYQATLSASGASVTVTGGDPVDVTTALGWVKQTYAELQAAESSPAPENPAPEAFEVADEAPVPPTGSVHRLKPKRRCPSVRSTRCG